MASRGNALVLTALSVAWFGAALGCGARTETLFDDGSGGSSAGSVHTGGQVAVGGAHPAAGSSQGGFGGHGTAGTVGSGGAFPTAGTNSGGSFSSAGTVGVGGAVPVGGFGGFGAFGGSVSTAGTFGTGGFGAIGGTGAGGSGVIVDLCVNAAQNACDKCTCQTCGSELNACVSDRGCLFILGCVQQTKCQGFGCYQNNSCRSVIDQFGGLTGGAVNEVFSLVSCSVTSRPGCGCN